MLATLITPAFYCIATLLACPPEAQSAPPATVTITKVRRAAAPVAVAQATPTARASAPCEGSAPDRVVNPPLDRGATLVWQRAANDQDGKPVVVYARARTAPADDLDLEDEEAAAVAVEAAPPIAAGGPWLGIQFGPVPEALAAHLDAQNAMILLNIAKDSPADQADLRQYDVVTAIDGHDMSSDASAVMDVIKELQPSQNVEIKLIRRGKPLTVSLLVGNRPEDVSNLEYKYKSPPEVASAQIQTLAPQFYTLKNGRLLVPDDEAFKQLQTVIPLLKDQQRQGELNALKGIQKSYSVIRQTDDGQTVEIRSEPDGGIKVSRIDRDGDRTSKSYADADELKKDDAEAFKLYEESRASSAAVAPGAGAWWSHRWNDKDFDLRMKAALEAYRAAQKNIPKASEELDAARKQLDVRLHELFENAARIHNTGYSFRTGPDGSIEVVARHGDDELVQTFRNEEALRREKPDLFERYERLRSKESRNAK